MARLLPWFFQYTVDLRLGEFRSVCQECGALEFIPFECDKGDTLLMEVLAFYEAGGTLFTIEHDGNVMNVVPVALSELQDAILRANSR